MSQDDLTSDVRTTPGMGTPPDPARSGRPVESFASVSVVADSCLVAGAASTLAMLLGVEAGAAYLRELGLPHLTIDAEGRCGGNIEI